MKSKNIFFADDDADDRFLFAKAFAEVCSDHKLSTFDSNTSLLNELSNPESVAPDMVFIDLNMPDLNGLECLRIIKENPQYHDAPVIIYSTIKSPTFIEEVYQLGAAYFIQKPFDFYQLAHLIKYVVNDDEIRSVKTHEDFVLTYDSIKKKPLL